MDKREASPLPGRLHAGLTSQAVRTLLIGIEFSLNRSLTLKRFAAKMILCLKEVILYENDV